MYICVHTYTVMKQMYILKHAAQRVMMWHKASVQVHAQVGKAEKGLGMRPPGRWLLRPLLHVHVLAMAIHPKYTWTHGNTTLNGLVVEDKPTELSCMCTLHYVSWLGTMVLWLSTCTCTICVHLSHRQGSKLFKPPCLLLWSSRMVPGGGTSVVVNIVSSPVSRLTRLPTIREIIVL